MISITNESLKQCSSFITEFVNSHYSGAELAELLNTSMTVISFKRNCIRWTIAELEKIFENKGFVLSFEMGHNVDTTLQKRKRPAVGDGNWNVASKYNCVRLKFIQDYILRYNIDYQTLISTKHYMLLNKAFNKDDIRYSYLLSIVARLGAELRVDIVQKCPAKRTVVGGLVVVAKSAVTIDKIVVMEDESGLESGQEE